MQVHLKHVTLTIKKEFDIPMLDRHKYNCTADFAPTKRGNKSQHLLQAIRLYINLTVGFISKEIKIS